MGFTLEAFSRDDHDRHAGIEVPDASDEDAGQMEVARIGQDVDPELPIRLNPAHLKCSAFMRTIRRRPFSGSTSSQVVK
jgi:hypothetical protein